jgi:hypothetical protein
VRRVASWLATQGEANERGCAEEWAASGDKLICMIAWIS